MIIKLPFFEITITFVSARKVRVLRDIKNHSKIQATMNYKNRYGCSLKEALDYVRSVEDKQNETTPS